MLPAIDVDLGAVHVRARLRAQHVNDLGHLVGRAQALQRNLLDDLLGAGRQDCGVDLARRNGVDANAEAAEVAPPPPPGRGPRPPPGWGGPSRLPPAPLGEIAALFTSACSSWPSIRRLISSMAERVLASSARLTWT